MIWRDIMPIEVGLALFGHQGDTSKLGTYGRIIHRVAAQKRAPISFYFTGTTLDAISCHHPLLKAALSDPNIFPRGPGTLNPYVPEIGISSSRFFPLVPLGLELQFWGHALGMSSEQIRWSKECLWYNFGKDARGFFPSELVFAPAGAQVIRDNRLSYAVINGMNLNQWERGQVFQVDGLKLIPRNPDIYLGGWLDPRGTRNHIKWLAGNFGVSRVVIGGDIDACDNSRISEHDWVRFLCLLSDALYEDPATELRNVASIADNYWHPRDLRDVYRDKGIWDPHHFTTSWIDAGGVLDFLRDWRSGQVNDRVNDFIRYYAHLLGRMGGSHHAFSRLESVKYEWYKCAGMEFRHPSWIANDWFWNHFWGTHHWAMGEMRRIDSNLWDR